MDKLGEVIESSTREWVAEVYRDAEPPPFGSWVQVHHQKGEVLFGLVSHVEVGAFEPSRQAIALGMTQEELRREMPHVLELLRTTFRAQIIAYQDQKGVIHQTLPPHPPGIHDFVYPCREDQVSQLGPPFDYLRTLVRHPDPSVPVDDILVAVLTSFHKAHGGRHAGGEALVQAGKALSRLLNDDHERLQSILRRVA